MCLGWKALSLNTPSVIHIEAQFTQTSGRICGNRLLVLLTKW
jgi:hypothetical protein